MPSLRCYPSHGRIHRRVWHPCHTHAALPGGAAVSAAPTRAIVHQHCNPPTESTEHTEASGGEEPPTDFTDAHRWLGCVGFSHGIHRSFWRRRASHRCAQMRTDGLAAYGSPTEFTEFTEASGGEEPPTDFTDFTDG